MLALAWGGFLGSVVRRRVHLGLYLLVIGLLGLLRWPGVRTLLLFHSCGLHLKVGMEDHPCVWSDGVLSLITLLMSPLRCAFACSRVVSAGFDLVGWLRIAEMLHRTGVESLRRFLVHSKRCLNVVGLMSGLMLISLLSRSLLAFSWLLDSG